MVTGTELKVTESKELRRKVSSVLEAAKKMVVKTQKDYALAGEKLKDVKTKMQLVKDYWFPSKSKAKATYDEIRANEKEMLGPLAEAEKVIKAAIGVYAAHMEKVREEQQRVAQEKARKAAQEKHDREVAELKAEEERKRKELEKVRAAEERKRKIAEAAKEKERIAREKVERAKAAEDAKTEKAVAELAKAKKKREEAQEKVREEKAKADDLKREAAEAEEETEKKEAAPVVTDAVKEKRGVPKHDGINVRDVWDAEVFSLEALVKTAAEKGVDIKAVLPNSPLLNVLAKKKIDPRMLLPNMPLLNALATEHKEAMNVPGEFQIPGVKSVKNKSVAAAARKGGII